jgi:hypothetical protein
MYTLEDLYKTLKGVFQEVKIYRIFNLVSPYFLFICQDTKSESFSLKNETITSFLKEKKKAFLKGEVKANFQWSKNFFSKMMPLKMIKYLLLSLNSLLKMLFT